MIQWSWSCCSYRDQNNFFLRQYLIVSQILHSLTKPQNQKALIWYWCTLDSLITFLIQFAGDPEPWKGNEVCWRAMKTLLSQTHRQLFHIFMGGVKQLFDFILFKQISGKSFLYAHTQQIYHANSAFHSVIGGIWLILKCNNLDLRIWS